jgi:hypothetical protein
MTNETVDLEARRVAGMAIGRADVAIEKIVGHEKACQVAHESVQAQLNNVGNWVKAIAILIVAASVAQMWHGS